VGGDVHKVRGVAVFVIIVRLVMVSSKADFSGFLAAQNVAAQAQKPPWRTPATTKR